MDAVEKKIITNETAELMIEFAAYLLDMKADDWRHDIDIDRQYARESIKWFLEIRDIVISNQ